MGCDIHVMFETLGEDGGWHPTFEPHPSQYWSDDIIDDMVEDGSAVTAFGPPTDEEIAEWRAAYPHRERQSVENARDGVLVQKVRAYLDSLSPEEVIATYSNREGFMWDFFPQSTKVQSEWNADYWFVPIDSRDYNWFSFLAQVRGEDARGFTTRGHPDDMSRPVRQACKRWDGDAHSKSWLLVREILDRVEEGEHEYQVKWLRQHISDPDKTRMIFFFDN